LPLGESSYFRSSAFIKPP